MGTSLLEQCKCFPREDVFSIFSLGSVREIHSLGKYFSVHSLGHSEYQEIHTFSALNIDSVKINTSLLMMRECTMQLYLQACVAFTSYYFLKCSAVRSSSGVVCTMWGKEGDFSVSSPLSPLPPLS